MQPSPVPSSLPSSGAALPVTEAPTTPLTAPAVPVAATARAWTETHPLLLALSLLLIAFNLRPVFGSLSVVLPDIMRDTGLGATGASLLTTLPIVCLGLFAAPAPALARRFGAERTLLGAMALICLGTLLRAWVSLPLLFASSVLAGACIAIGNVLLLCLIVMRSANAHVTAQLSAMAQGWGYALAAFGPLLVGLLRGWTGGFASSAALVIVIGTAMAWSGWGAGRKLLVQPCRG